MTRVTVGVLLVLLCIVIIVEGGPGKRTGTAGAAQLLIPVGTRDIAMGGSGVATTAGIAGLYWNPAGLARGEHDLNFFASHMQYLADLGVSAAALSLRIPSLGVLGLTFKSISMDAIPVTTVLAPDGTGSTFTPQFFTVGLAYATQLTDRVFVGGTITIISEQMHLVSATGLAFDLGVTYQDLGGIRGSTFGVAIKNIGAKMAYDGSGLNIEADPSDLNRGPYLYQMLSEPFELPTTIDIGLGYEFDIAADHRCLISTAFRNNNYSDDEFKIGLEYSFQRLFFVRGGYDYAPPASNVRESIFGPSWGVGLRTDLGGAEVAIDYAFRGVKFFQSNHLFSATVGL